MSSEQIVIDVAALGKRYEIFERPSDRLKQPLLNRLRALFGRPPGQLGREHWALQDVSFQIHCGETVGIIGRNGSGKSTLLQMICGTLAPSTGQVVVNGRVAALLELGAGFNPEFTGRENVYMNAAILGLDRTDIESRFDRIEAFADIGSFIDQPVATYSSGMYVRLAFAVIAHVDADVLVIDEALAVGDVFFTQKCMRFLRDFQQRGTILFVSHDSAAVVNLCERAIWLDKGRLCETGPAHRVCEHYLAGRYDGKVATGTEPLAESTPNRSAMAVPTIGAPDVRAELLNRTQLRNDIDVFKFAGPARHFGQGGAEVLDAFIGNADGVALSRVVGGEAVEFFVRVHLRVAVARIIIGFFFKDRLGQVLFGENSYLTYFDSPFSAQPGDTVEARFAFRMPILPQGGYAVDVAVADGTHEDHQQLQWIHDAFVLESHASSTSTGLIGIPFGPIELRKLPLEPAAVASPLAAKAGPDHRPGTANAPPHLSRGSG